MDELFYENMEKDYIAMAAATVAWVAACRLYDRGEPISVRDVAIFAARQQVAVRQFNQSARIMSDRTNDSLAREVING